MIEVREITDRETWLAWRQNVITASRIGALFDCHHYMTRDDLAASLRGEPQADTPAMRAGRLLEPSVAVGLAEEHPEWRIRKATTFHVDRALRIGCTPDFWLDDDALIQAKSVDPDIWEEWRGKAPLMYQLQTLTEMMLTGRTRGVLGVVVKSRSLPVYTFDVPRHPTAEQRILRAVADWWAAWDAGEIAAPAAPDGLDTDLDDGSVIDLSASNELPGLLEERAELKLKEAAAKARLDVIDANIKEQMGTARSGWLPGWKLSYPTLQRKAYAVKAGNYRRLTITRTED